MYRLYSGGNLPDRADEINILISDYEQQEISESESAIAELKRKIIKSDDDIIRTIWTTFEGISMTNADIFAEKWTIMDVLSKKIPEFSLQTLRYPGGRKISSKIIKSLTSDNLNELKLIQKIPGFKNNAIDLLSGGQRLLNLLQLDVGDISNIKVGKTKKCLGKIKAEKLIKYFNTRVNICTIECPVVEN